MKRLNSIQSLRALAASVVVLFHIRGIEEAYGDPSAPLLTWFDGSFGVDIFFVISGFIMVYVSLNKPFNGAHFKRFLTKRIIRVVPAYWFYTLLTVVLLLVMPQLFKDTRFDLLHTVKSFLFIPDYTLPVVAVGWTMNYEMYFYLVFACFLLLPQRFLVPGLSLVLIGSAGIGLFYRNPWPVWHLMTNPLLIEFLLGVYLGYLYLQGKYLSRRLAWLAVIGGVGLLALSQFYQIGSHRLFYWGIPGAMLVSGALSLEGCGYSFSGPVARLGDSSYSLYLSHAFTLNVVGRSMAFLGLAGYAQNLLNLLIGYIASVVVGIVSFYLIEKTSAVYLSRKFGSRPGLGGRAPIEPAVARQHV